MTYFRTFKLVLVTAVALVLGLSASVFATEFYPLNEVRPGMRGFGRTVIEGDAIETFEVEILGTLEYQGLVDQLILVRVSGELMEKSGGIAQGMSGSPVYLDGKLLGALSYGYGFADHFIGMVTPINAMLSVLDLVPGDELKLSKQITIDGKRYDRVALAPSVRPSTLELRPISTPLMVSGMGPRGVSRLQHLFAGKDIAVRNIGAMSGNFRTTLEPGSPIAVDLIKGDIRVSALGTITYIDPSGRFVAFGHPFSSRGNSQYFASYAQILTTVQSIETPFKIGTPGGSFGIVSQDRQAGIAGRISTLPEVVPVKVKVRDLNMQREREFSFTVVDDPAISINLIDSAALQSIDATLDRIGPGTAWVEFKLSGDDLPAGGFSRQNLFFSSVDIAAVSLGELYEALDLVLNNEFSEVDISDVTATILVEEYRRTAKIEKARLLTDQVFPGDTVEVEVTLRPWRQNPITRVVKLEIPRDIEAGEVSVTVRNGSYTGYITEEEVDHQEEIEEPGKPDNPAEIKTKKNESATKTNAESLELLISDFVLREKNNQVVAEFYPPIAYSGESEFGTELAVEDEEFGDYADSEEYAESEAYVSETELSSDTISASLDTEYVVEGTTTVTMQIQAYSELNPGDEVTDWSGVSIRHTESN